MWGARSRARLFCGMAGDWLVEVCLGDRQRNLVDTFQDSKRGDLAFIFARTAFQRLSPALLVIYRRT
jgi:hypothetical protein